MHTALTGLESETVSHDEVQREESPASTLKSSLVVGGEAQQGYVDGAQEFVVPGLSLLFLRFFMVSQLLFGKLVGTVVQLLIQKPLTFRQTFPIHLDPS